MTTPIDQPTFAELQQAVGPEFVQELVDTFLAEAPGMLRGLREAMAVRNADDFRRAAHSLKSNSNTFGALMLGKMARELELAGLDQAMAAHPQPLAGLEHEYARVAAALTELRNA
jgi:HPt (histidine-containing phosphotransfer) domain-containing protein